MVLKKTNFSCLHLLNSYLPLTETFIWQYLSHAHEFQPLILAGKVENQKNFPLPNGILLQSKPSRNFLALINARIQNDFAQSNFSACLAEINKLQPDLAHVHNGFRACVSTRFLVQSKLPFLINFYGSDLSKKQFLHRAKMGYDKLFKIAHGFLVEGPSMKEKLLSLGCPEDRIHIQRIAINPNNYIFRERSWDGSRPIRFLFIGRLVEKKGLETGLEALAKIHPSIPWQLEIIGDGPLRGKLEIQISHLKLEKHAHILGFMSYPEIQNKMNFADIMFQPSQTAQDGDSEGGAPTVILEAQAAGMPIISTTHGDIPYITIPSHSSFLSPEKDIESLSKNIHLLIEKNKDWGAMGRTGRDHVEKFHHVEKEVIKLEQIYKSILS